MNPNHDAKGLFAAADSGGSGGGGTAGSTGGKNPPRSLDEQKAMIQELLHEPSATDKGRQSRRYRMIDAAEADRIKNDTGLDVSGYVHSAAKSEMNHILNEHGVGNESRQQHVPVTEADFLKIPEIVANPDSTKRLPRKGNEDVDRIEHKKRFNGTTFVVEEVRIGKKELALKSMHKVASGTTNAGAGAPPQS